MRPYSKSMVRKRGYLLFRTIMLKQKTYAFATKVGCRAPETFAVTLRSDL